MNEITFPVQSKATIIKASAAALMVASIVFITVILPAEYNIDPTGAGELMGLTMLTNDSSGEAITPSETKPLLIEPIYGYQEHEVIVIVPANKGVEYKFKLQRYSKITYEWTSSGTPLYFDFHGEPKGDTSGYFESYAIATASNMQGSMTVPFDGVHGWYWKNNSDQEIAVTLKTMGDYEVVGVPH